MGAWRTSAASKLADYSGVCSWTWHRGQTSCKLRNGGLNVFWNDVSRKQWNTGREMMRDFISSSYVKGVQLCLTLCDPMDHTAHGILQARILEWVTFLFSKRSSQPRIKSGLLHCRQILYQVIHKGSPGRLAWVDYCFSSVSSWPRNLTRVFCITGGFFTNWAIGEVRSQAT